MVKAIRNGKVILEEGIYEEKVIVYSDKILDILEEGDEEALGKYEDIAWLDAEGQYVSPGFIDIHIHGFHGRDTMDESEDSLEVISSRLCENGVTAFLPTTMTMSRNRIIKTLERVRTSMYQQMKGARVLGAHLEGPFINPVKKGAHCEASISKPDYELVQSFSDTIKIVTLAPEMDPGLCFIKKVKEHHAIALSMGHSDADYELALEAIKAGIGSVTHLFNAMTGLTHRSPGIVGAAFNSDVYCELIADKIHVHPAVFKIVSAVKGMDRIILITDSICAAGMSEGRFELGGQAVNVKGCEARLFDGTLAGSVLRMNEALRNLVEGLEVDLCQAVKTVSRNPARLIGQEDKRGSIARGKYADLTIFDDAFNVSATIVEGQTCYRR